MDLNTREKSILELIYRSETPILANMIAERLNISRRSVYYEIKSINQYLEIIGVGPLSVQYGKGYYFTDSQKRYFTNVFNSESSKVYYQFLPYERVNIIILVLSGVGKTTIDSLMSICNVSRNTIISDLELVKEIMEEYNVDVISEKFVGVSLAANPIQSRSIFIHFFNQVRNLYRANVLNFIETDVVDAYVLVLQRIEAELNTKYVDGVLESLAVLLSIIPQVEQDLSHFDDINIKQIKLKEEYRAVDEYLTDFSIFEKIYITIHLLGGRVQFPPDIVRVNTEDQELYDLCRYMVYDFESIACVKYENSEGVLDALFTHLKSSIYRYRYGIDIGNPLVKTIKKKYYYLFEITRNVSKDLTKFLGNPTNENEIAYLTIIFGSQLNQSKLSQKSQTVYVVCFESASIAKMLKNELEYIASEVNFEFITDIDKVKKISNRDQILSTHDIEIERNYLRIQSVLTDIDKNNVINYLIRKHPSVNHTILLDAVKDSISNYLNEEQQFEVNEELEKIFSTYTTVDYEQEKRNPSILDILKVEEIKICNDEVSWDEAIDKTGESLVQRAAITSDYLTKIKSIVMEKGPYMYLAPGLFLAHASPNDGVNQLSLSMSVFRKGVLFGNRQYVNIVLCLAPIDYHMHLRIINEIMEVFENEETYKEIVSCETNEDIYEVLENKLNKRRVK